MKSKFLVVLSVFVAIGSTSASANSEKITYVGGSMGAAQSLNGSHPHTGFVFQASVGGRVSKSSSLYLGGFYHYMYRSARFGNDILYSDETLSLFGPEIMFRDLFESGLFVGARIGIGYRTQSKSFLFVPAGYDSFTALGGGPVIGYDFRITDQVSIGAETSLTFVNGGSVKKSNSTRMYLDADQMLNAVVNFKLFF